MTKTKFTNSYQKWTRDDDFCLLRMWNSGTPMIEIERVLNRSENACESRVHRLRHDQLIGSINEFFDELSAKLDIDPRVLKNKVDVILDDEKYRELKGRVDSRLDDTVIKVDAFCSDSTGVVNTNFWIVKFVF